MVTYYFSMQRQARSVLLLLCPLGLGCTPNKPLPSTTPEPSRGADQAAVTSDAITFDDRTKTSGLNSVYRNGREAGENAILESLGGGVGLIDFDRDGKADLVFPHGGMLTQQKTIEGSANQIYRNVGGFEFQDVSHEARLDLDLFYTHGCAIADVDNDGFSDILITGYGGLQLYHNLGDGTFQECANAIGLVDDQWSSSAAWGDFNSDGALDLYVAHYVDWSWQNHPKCSVVTAEVEDVCSPHQFTGLTDAIFLNSADGRFIKQPEQYGLEPEGKGLGVIAADFDLDGDLDVYVANDTTNNFLYINDEGTFNEVGLASGLATDADGVPNGSMGIAVLDTNGDLRPDVWVTNYENETFGLYENVGNANFNSISQRAGVSALGTLFVGFGTVASDLDLDGDEDLCVANGHVINFPKLGKTSQYQLVLRNEGRRFVREEFPASSYLGQEHLGRSLVVHDFNEDGLPDLVFANTNEPAAILENKTLTTGQSFLLRLVGNVSNRDAIGAHAVLRTSKGDYLRCVVGGGGYLSQNLYELRWGVPEGAKLQEVIIHWPSGLETQMQLGEEDSTAVAFEPTN